MMADKLSKKKQEAEISDNKDLKGMSLHHNDALVVTLKIKGIET